MKYKCFVCGELKPNEELGAICVQDDFAPSKGCRRGILCIKCSDVMGHDMWSCESEWNGVWSGDFEPKIKYNQLPDGCVTDDCEFEGDWKNEEHTDVWREKLFAYITRLMERKNASASVCDHSNPQAPESGE